MSRAYLRLAVDIGGTFTDSVLMDSFRDVLANTKTLTTHHDPSEGAIAAIQRTLDEAGASMDDVATFVHGTTLATNALIERRGAHVATVATEGFRNILDIANERRYRQYDLNLTKFTSHRTPSTTPKRGAPPAHRRRATGRVERPGPVHRAEDQEEACGKVPRNGAEAGWLAGRKR